MSYTGSPAFPGSYTGQNGVPVWSEGMTLRDYFAAQAMAFSPQSFEEIAGIAHKAGDDHRKGFYVAAKFAYQIADAMLEARSQRCSTVR